MDMSQEPFCVKIYTENAAHYFPGAHFVWKVAGKNAHGHCTRDHKGHFVWKFRGKMPEPRVPTSIKHGPSVPCRKNPFSVATLFGEKRKSPHRPQTVGVWTKGDEASGGDDDDDDTQRRAQRSRHMRADRGEHTDESTHRRAHI